MKVSVIGLGYIGLPTALLLAREGNEVIGVDIDENKVNSLREGNIYIREEGMLELFEEAKDNIEFATQPKKSEFFIIAVPTPVKDEKPDLRSLHNAIDSIKPVLEDGNAIIIESTMPPGTTESIKSELKEEGFDIEIAHSPERAFPGNLLHEFIHNDRLLGCTKETAEKIKSLFSFSEADFHITDPTTAEIVKSAENTYRDINIAFANELADLSEKTGSNVWDVIELANKHPRVNIHLPGPGVGGHCIPIDPWFLDSSKKSNLIETSRKINEDRPRKVVDTILEKTKNIENPKICILGRSYKENVDDTRESPSLKISNILDEENINHVSHDPFNGNVDIKTAIDNSDCIVLVTGHKQYDNLDVSSISDSVRNKLLIDTRNFFEEKRWEENGFEVTTLGRGGLKNKSPIKRDVYE